MRKLSNFVLVLNILFLLWFIFSWADVINGNNMPGNVIQSWNFFRIF